MCPLIGPVADDHALRRGLAGQLVGRERGWRHPRAGLRDPSAIDRQDLGSAAVRTAQLETAGCRHTGAESDRTSAVGVLMHDPARADVHDPAGAAAWIAAERPAR